MIKVEQADGREGVLLVLAEQLTQSSTDIVLRVGKDNTTGDEHENYRNETQYLGVPPINGFLGFVVLPHSSLLTPEPGQ